jgi:hypothetical protein
VCFYTDGVVEARIDRDLFGEARLSHALAELGAGATASTLLDRVAAESDLRPDDMAACLLRMDGGSGAPAVQIEELELDRREAEGDRAERFLLACGVHPDEIAEVMRSARATVERSGSAVMEVRMDGAVPEVTLRHDNVALLHATALETASAS